MKINSVVIVGGTHGNESTGVFLYNKLKNQLTSFKGIKINYLLSNPKAAKECKRFIDHDLNRSFAHKDLNNIEKTGYEFNRAKAINSFIGPKGNPSTDFIIDMHTTTANMGVSVILVEQNPLNIRLAAYLSSKIKDLKIYSIGASAYMGDNDHSFLNSVTPHGFSLEVGPIANGIVRGDILQMTENTINHTLDFLQAHNNNTLGDLPETVEIFEHEKKISYPVDENKMITAYIHEEFEDKNYLPLKKGDPIFKTMNNEIIYFEEDKIYYPVFINEAAYYYKKTAFSLTTLNKIKVPQV
jgi:aspartoacylase